MKDFVVGSRERYSMSKAVRTCSKWGVLIYFTDDWDWDKFDPICFECSKGVKEKEYKLHEKTVQKTMKLFGIPRERVIEAFEDIKRGE